MKPYQLLFAPALAAVALGMAAPSPAVGPAVGPAGGPAPGVPIPAMPIPPMGTSGVGDALPAPEFSDFLQTEAKSFEDYKGRAVLIEFFEYW